MSVEKKIKAKSGYGMLAIVAVLLVVIVGLFIWSVAGMAGTPEGIDTPAVYGWGLGVSIFAFLLWFIPLSGFFSLQPGQARVCILFGKYVGTVRDEGFFWANPFYSKSMGSSAGIGEMLELEMSDSQSRQGRGAEGRQGQPHHHLHPRAHPERRAPQGQRQDGQPHRDRQRGGVACGRYRQGAL